MKLHLQTSGDDYNDHLRFNTGNEKKVIVGLTNNHIDSKVASFLIVMSFSCIHKENRWSFLFNVSSVAKGNNYSKQSEEIKKDELPFASTTNLTR